MAVPTISPFLFIRCEKSRRLLASDLGHLGETLLLLALYELSDALCPPCGSSFPFEVALDVAEQRDVGDGGDDKQG